jgi:hypothetical protein
MQQYNNFLQKEQKFVGSKFTHLLATDNTTPVAKRPLEHNTKHKNHKTHNNQHEPPLPYPPAALPSFAMATSAMASNQGTAAHYESIAGARWQVHASGCLFLCLGR